MAITNIKIKLIKNFHDAKATIWTKAGCHLKKIKEHSKILDKLLSQDNSITHYTNEFEKNYYGSCKQIDFSHPETYLYVLKDVWVVGSEGCLFFEPDQLFSVCSSLKGLEERKIRRPIKLLAKVIEEPVFILSSRAPGNRGHFLVEHLPRLVASMDAIKRLGGCKILVTPMHRKWQAGYLQKLGIPESKIIEASIGSTFCKRAFYVPTLCKGEIATVSREKYYQFLRKCFISSMESSRKGLPIFLSRKDAPDRKLSNEDAIFSIAKTFFPEMKRVVMSTLSLNEQIRLFQEAPVIIGPHSQPFRDILFSSNSLVIQLIQGIRDTSNEYYQWAQNYNYVGGIGKNLCLPLFSKIEFNTNSDWIYPEDKFKKDMSQLISLLDRQKILSNYVL
jgi:capsular polysaccharide biosynthesis protein